MKKIIKIGGTAYSGSTLLDLILSNDPNGFSCGEMYALFRPHRKHHFRPKCSCNDPKCDIWGIIQEGGEHDVWKNLSNLLPNISFFVDSSKNTENLADQINSDDFRGFEVFNIIIWKTPVEFAYSCYKRNKLSNWKKSYVNYHKQYFSIVNKWYSVRYSEFVSDTSQKLRRLCEIIGINYFPGKENYWSKEHHTLFGSDSAKLHLYSPEEQKYKEIEKDRSRKKPNVIIDKEPEVKHHRRIYSSTMKNILERLPKNVQDEIKNDEELRLIHDVLTYSEISADRSDYKIKDTLSLLKPQFSWKIQKKIKRNIMRIFAQFF